MTNSKDKPFFSIVTASFNSEKTIEKTINSVMKQTFRSYEHIIIDGMSSDRTMEIVSEYKNYLSYIVSEQDNGIYDAFNKGVVAAKGEVIYFLNSDDYFADNDVLEKVAKAFCDKKRIDFVCTNIEVVDEKQNHLFYSGKKMTINDFKMGQTYPHQGFFARKELFYEYGFFNKEYPIVADLDFMIKCFKDKEKQYVYLDETVTCFRIGGTSTNYNNRQNTINEANKVLVSYFPEMQVNSKGNIDINILYRKWLELNLIHEKGISNSLLQKGISNIAIFGAMKTGQYFLKDCLTFSKIQVLSFLDNNSALYSTTIHSVPINNPNWLKENGDKIDAIVLTVEGNYDEAIKNQLMECCGDKEIPIYSWKEMLARL